MTSNPPAGPRPPPLKRPPEQLRPSHERQGSTSSLSGSRTPQVQRHGLDFADDRPAKRRRVDGNPAANQAAVVANANARPPISSLDKRPPRFHLVPMSSITPDLRISDTKHDQDKSVAAELPDLPSRPWTSNSQSSSTPVEPKPSHRSRVNIPVPTVPDAMKEPSSVPHLVMQRPAGFFPWTGKHPEDVMSDITVKQGYFDKPPNPTEKELNTARVPLYNAFKHKSGVDNLSILFSLVLDQKNHHGVISSLSNFKPPPRVTLTETKRKSWIADLANADVPLRRLSRTIPQGIRGQILLDQCLQNAVPLSRAIWFAKCVCANEIRTLKRKGTTPAMAIGAEYKWLREWTIHVEQFIEAQLAQSHLAEWRPSIEYALRLVTRLYLENLLDRDHYLDWIVKSLGLAEVKQVPFWLMLIHIYEADLSHYRKRGRKLAEALVARYDALRRSANSFELPIRKKIHQMTRSLLLSRPTSFLMPEKWPEYVAVVEACLDLDSVPEQRILSHLNQMNKRVMGYNKRQVSSQRSPEESVIDILDSAHAPYDVPALAQDLAAACEDPRALISTCLEWTTSRFRHSHAHTFLFARLAKRWQRGGHDVDSVLLNYISACRDRKTSVEPTILKRLAAQLSRSGAFPVGKYIQWLMVRGLPKKGTITLGTVIQDRPDERSSDGEAFESDPTQLLLDLSLQHVQHHTVNLRNSVLSRAGFDVEMEHSLIQRCKSYVLHELQRLGSSTHANFDLQDSKEPAFAQLHWTTKTAVSAWLRSHVAQAVAASAPSLDAHAILTSHMMINCEQFCYIRYVLESMEDHAVLGDVVGILTCARDEELLASLVATLQYHADSFSAIGALEVLQQRICQIYMSWRPVRPAMRSLAASLLELCTKFPVSTPSVKLLQQDLVRGDRGRAVAACSPYSDGIAESLQQAGATFIEDFEAILQSEPNMTEQTMTGLFSVLVDRIEKQQSSPDDMQMLLSFCHLLGRLRLCRKVQGDTLVKRWLARLVPTLDLIFGTILVRTLIATGCIDFDGLSEGLLGSKMELRKSPQVKNVIKETLSTSAALGVDPLVYQVRTKWWDYVQREPRPALEILCEPDLKAGLQSSRARLLAALVHDSSPTTPALSPHASDWAVNALDHLLIKPEEKQKTPSLRALFGSIDCFSHSFVQLRFSLNRPLQASNVSGGDGEELVNGLFEALEQLLDGKDGSPSDVSQFSQLLQTVGPEVANRLRHKVEAEFLEASPKIPWNKATSPMTATFPSHLHTMASTVERAFQVCTPVTTPMPGFVSQLIDKLSHYIKFIGFQSTSSTAPAIPGLSNNSAGMSPAQVFNPTSSPMATSSEVLNATLSPWVVDYLRYMLQMICLQRTALIAAGRSPNGKQAQHDQVQVLARLALIATHSVFASPTTSFGGKAEQQMAQAVRDFTFDVIATIVDDVSDDVKTMSVKMLKGKVQDVRLTHLFGSVNSMGSVQTPDAGHGLMISKEGKGILGEWKPRVWEVIDNGSGKESETSIGLGLFGARRG